MKKLVLALLLLLSAAPRMAADNPPDTTPKQGSYECRRHDAVQQPGMSEASVRKVGNIESRSDDAANHDIAAPTICDVVPPALRWVDGVTFRALTPASQSFMLG